MNVEQVVVYGMAVIGSATFLLALYRGRGNGTHDSAMVTAAASLVTPLARRLQDVEDRLMVVTGSNDSLRLRVTELESHVAILTAQNEALRSQVLVMGGKPITDKK